MKRENIMDSLKTSRFMVFIFAVELACLAILVAFTVNTFIKQHQATDQLNKVIELQHRSFILADQLRQSSDDLTRMVRSYAATGEERFKDYFHRIIAIRDGKAPRPNRYEAIFWDFVVAGTRKLDKDNGPPESLHSLMEKSGFTKEEFSLLEEAHKRSDALINMEEIAINAMLGNFLDEKDDFTIHKTPDRELALKILFGPKYHQAKNDIMEPINEFFTVMNNRTATDVAKAQQTIHTLSSQLILLFGMLTVIFPAFAITGYLYHRASKRARQKTEIEKEKLEEQLRQAEKLQAIGQLAGGIAHDFNNQLSAVLGYSEVLEDHIKDPKFLKYIANIRKAAQRSADMTKQLLAFSRKGKNRSVVVDMHKIVNDVIEILEHSIDKKIRINKTFKACPSTTTGDPDQLQNVILNLALNARDAMPSGGELTFESEIAVLDERFSKNHPYEIKPGEYLKISVNDTGHGIDSDTMKHIFEPFFTTKEIGKGTGMGLASVYGTIRNHNGAISVYSEPGKGATFRIYMPLSDDEAKTKIPRSSNRPITGTARILLVDDEETFREMAHDILTDLGYKVTVCNDGQEAVGLYKKSWQEFDLVILDMVMPVIGGRATFIAMREINPQIRAILSSGYSLNGEAQEIIDEGVKDFIGKPFELSEMAKTIARVLKD